MPGDVGGDRLEVAVGLRVPGIDVAGTAFEPEQDDGVRLAVGGSLGLGCGRKYSLSVKAEKAERAGADESFCG